MLVRFGKWLFNYRNILFPFFYAALFVPSPSVFSYNFGSLLVGSVFIILGVVIRGTTIGLVYIIRGGSKRQIHAETLVTEGIYQICRNPMYLGNIVLITGFGFLANSILFLTVFTPLFIFFYYAIIKAEEDFLLKKFRAQYKEYISYTNALIPNLTKIKKAFEGHRFNFKKVLNKEHNSLFLYFIGILMLLRYQNFMTWSVFSFISSLLFIIYLYIKLLKRIKKL